MPLRGDQQEDHQPAKPTMGETFNPQPIIDADAHDDDHFPTHEEPTPNYDSYPVGDSEGDGRNPDPIGELPGRLPGEFSAAQREALDEDTTSPD